MKSGKQGGASEDRKKETRRFFSQLGADPRKRLGYVEKSSPANPKYGEVKALATKSKGGPLPTWRWGGGERKAWDLTEDQDEEGRRPARFPGVGVGRASH